MFHIQYASPASAYRGALTLKSGTGMCRGHDPLLSSQLVLLSLPIYPQCIAHVPPFSIFSLVLAKISVLKTQIFQSFVLMTPNFSRKTHSLDPNFGNPCGTHPPKKSWIPPPPGADATDDSLYMWGTPTEQGACDFLSKMSLWYHCKKHPFSFNLIPKSSSYSSYFLRYDHLCVRP